MADFHQQGIITTLHDLTEHFQRNDYLESLERKLEGYASKRRIALLLPLLFGELKRPDVIDRIIGEIGKVSYLHAIIVALGGATSLDDFRFASDYFDRLRGGGRDLKLVWVDGPRIQEVLGELGRRRVPLGVPGKGKSVWIAIGYIVSRGDCDVIALHDCDIVTYERILLGRLVEPVANPNNEFEFCKGYYARISPAERTMKGRVTRLFVSPFVDAMADIVKQRRLSELEQFFRYHHTFHYPLSGEISLTTRLAQGINIAYDWGLEVSTLSEVYGRLVPRKIAQIDLACNYEHKHKDLSPENSGGGLHRMVVDISKFYLSYIRSHGVPLDDSFVEMVGETYYQNALRFVKIYSDDAEVNDLVFDRYEEELAARHFRGFLTEGWEELAQASGEPVLASWNRIFYSMSDIYSGLCQAVESDNAR